MHISPRPPPSDELERERREKGEERMNDMMKSTNHVDNHWLSPFVSYNPMDLCIEVVLIHPMLWRLLILVRFELVTYI
jgi:hypothetical protein